MAFFINESCTNCDACRPLCPAKCIFVGDSQYYIDADDCQFCELCPVEAIHPIPKTKKEVWGNR